MRKYAIVLIVALLSISAQAFGAGDKGHPDQLAHRKAPPEGAGFEPIELYPLAPKGTVAGWMYTEANYNEAALTYSPHERVAVGLFGMRNHRPGFVELHYAFATITPRIARYQGGDQQLTFYALTGAGMGNKLSGINRFAYLAGGELDYETPRGYYNVRSFTLGASDFDQKTFTRARAGIAPYLANYNQLRTWLMMQLWVENRSDHESTWGPLLRFQHKNVYAEFYSTFKGLFGFSFSFYY